MPKKTKAKTTKKRKRGPREERLVISDPQAAIDRLLKPKPKKG
jgi:hypothetical protein